MKMDDSRKLACPNQKDLVIESFFVESLWS